MLKCGCEIKEAMIFEFMQLRMQKPEKFRTSTGFEPVTSRYRCDALSNSAMKPLTLRTGHLWVLMAREE